MRTTVTIDPDVETLIQDVMKERSISFKQALNEAAWNGRRGKELRPKFVQKTFHMGMCQDLNWNKALAIADALEDEELIRKMALRK